MSKQMAPQTKYAIKLGILTNSFYDPESKANLFRNTPYYFFNHKPTLAIKNAVKTGRLIDLNGAIEQEETAGEVDAQEVARLTSENEALRKENAALRVELEKLKASEGEEKAPAKKSSKAKDKATEEE